MNIHDQTDESTYYHDITERKRQQANLAFLAEVSQDLAGLTDIEATMNQLGAKLGAHFDASHCIFSVIDASVGTFTNPHVWYREGAVSIAAASTRLSDFYTDDYLRASHSGQTWVVRDGATDKRAKVADMAAIGIAAVIHVPLLRDGEWRFSFSITDAEPRDWREDEIDLMGELTNRIWTRLERARVEEALRQSEARLQLALDAAQMGTFAWYPQDDRGETDARTLALYGLDPTDVLNHTRGLNELVVPADRTAHADKVARALDPDGDGLLRSEYRIHRASDGAQRWIATLAQTQFAGEPPVPVSITGVCADITASKQAAAALLEKEQRQAFLLKLSDALHPLSDSARLERTAMQLLGQELGVNRAFFATIDADGEAWSIRHDYTNGMVSQVGRHPMPEFQRSRLSQWQAGLVSSISDSETDAGLGAAARAAYAVLGTRAAIGVPLVKGGRFVALLSVNQTVPRAWTEAELALTREAAERIWVAIEGAKVEEALRASQKRFESIANLVPDLLWDSEPDGTTNWYNQRWLDYTGQRFEEATGWGWTQAIHPDERAASASRYAQAMATGTALQQEHRIRRHDGAYRWFVVSTTPIKDEAGQVINMYGAATDITDRKLAQEALQQSELALAERRHLTLLSQAEALARMGSWEFHRASGQFTWSAGMYQLTQVEPQRVLVPEIYLELAIEANRTQAQQLIDYLRAGEGHVECQLRIRLGEASQTLRIKADVIGQGKHTRVVGVALDVTQQLLDQQRLRETADSLQAVLDGSPASIGLLKAQRDPTGQVIDFRLAVGNDKLARFVGEPLPALLHQPAQRFAALLWDGQTLARLHHIFTTRQGFYEEKQLPPPEQDTWVALSVTQQDDGVVLAVLDVTAMKQVQLQQQHWLSELEHSRHSVETLVELKAALQHRSETLRAVSHDLKSNFGIVTGALSLLELANSEAERAQVVEMALRNVKQATGLLGELLDLTRLEAHEQPRRLASHLIRPFLLEWVQSLQPLAAERQLALEASGPDGLIVETDPLVLYRLVQNLLMNALKYTHQGHVRISWDVHPEAEQWWLRVADTGPGLAPELVERLNSRQRAEVASERSMGAVADTEGGLINWATLRGEGIGLRIVREITTLLGGQLLVVSQPGQGTTFTIQLPLRY